MSVGEEEHKKDALPCGVVTKTPGNILTSKKTRNYGYYDDTCSYPPPSLSCYIYHNKSFKSPSKIK